MNLRFFNKKLNILILGSNGMLGKELVENFRKKSICRNSSINLVHGVDFPEVDLSLKNSLDKFLETSVHYDYIINCAAITDTRRIENDLRDLSYQVNSLSVKWIAQACKKYSSKLVHISTDYVFSEKTCSQFSSLSKDSLALIDKSADEFPINEYGLHKLVGELFIKTTLPCEFYSILRVSWLYGIYNNKSFIHKFLKNCWNNLQKSQNESVEIECTSNECSFPTRSLNVFKRIMNIINNNYSGIFHACDEFDKEDTCYLVSRYDFCLEILKTISQHIKDFERIKLVKKELDENSSMRYPQYSSMIEDLSKDNDKKSINYGIDNWKKSLEDFIVNNISSLREFIEK